MMNLKKLNNNWREAILLSACFVFTVSVLPSCKKKSSTLGTQVLSVDELLKAGGVDTFQLKTYTIDEDSIPTDNQTYGTVGACHDPKFGVMNTSVYSQLSIEGKVALGGEVLQQIDSVVLSLPYGGYYGKLTPQTFEVYELDDSLSFSSTYYRGNTKPTTGPNLVDPAYATQTPNTTARVLVDNGTSIPDTLDPQLRLRLSNSIGQRFVQDAISGIAAFNSTSEFLSSNYFKGIRINVANANPGPGSGGVLYFKMGNQECKLTVYFKVASSSTQKNFSLRLNGSSAYFNHADMDHSGYHVADVLANHNSGQTNFYAQCFGLWGAIDVPGISGLPKKSLINNALLYLPIAYQTGNVYNPSQTITLAYKNDAGENIVIQGSATTYDDGQKGFVVNLRSYIQDVAAGKLSNKTIYIIPSPNLFTSGADRLIFNGTSTSYKTKPKLVIKYTEFK